MQKRADKLLYLDGIRGVAAFLVFFHHFLLAFYIGYYSFDTGGTHLQHHLEVSYGQSVWSVISNGNFYVCIFFVLSGLVLSNRYFHSSSIDVLVSAAQRRFLRLYIPVAFTIVLSFFMLRAFLYASVPEVARIAHSWWLGPNIGYRESIAAFYRSLFYGTMFMNDATFDTSMWTMSVELYNSLFVFAFLALTHNTRRPIALVLILIYCALTANVFPGAFTLGISLNYVMRFCGAWNRILQRVLAVVLLATAIVLGSYPTTNQVKGTLFEHWPPVLLMVASWYHTIGGYCLILAFIISPRLQAIASMRLFRFLGYISFSLYLLHPLILSSFSCFLFLKLYGFYSYNISVLIVFGLTTVLCFAASWLMARYIDAPGTRAAGYIYTRLFRKNIYAVTGDIHTSEKMAKVAVQQTCE